MSTIKRLDDTSAIPALTGAGTASGDLFLVWDVSAAAYKSITRAELLAGLTGGNVAIGGTLDVTGQVSLAAQLNLNGNSVTGGHLRFSDSNTGGQAWQMGPGAGDANPASWNIYNETSSTLIYQFTKTGAAVMAGALLVGSAITSQNAFGNLAALQSAGGTGFRWTLNNDGTFSLQRTTDGFGSATTPMVVDASSIVNIGAGLRPVSDNAVTLGSGSFRWSVVYAGTGTINTSGRDSKTEIGEISDAERRAAARIQPRRFKFIDAVDAKGADARWHFGYIAEDVRDALAAEGLDPWAYGFLCSDPVTVHEVYTVTAQRPKVEEYQETERAVDIVDGVPRLTEKTVTRTRPVGSLQPVLDLAGAAVMVKAGSAPSGATVAVEVPIVTGQRAGVPELSRVTVEQPVLEDVMAPMTHFVPEMEDYQEEHTREVETGETRLGLRMDELAAFLRAAGV